MRIYSDHDFRFRAVYVPVLSRAHDIISIMMPNRAFASCIAFVAGLLLSGAFSFEIGFYGTLMILATYSSQAVYNNIRDIDGDRINAPDRPLARGSLSVDFAWKLMGGLMVAGVVFAIIASPILLVANAMFVLIGLIYSRFTKAMGILSYATLVSSHFVVPIAAGYLLGHALDVRIIAIVAFIYLTEVLAISIKDYKDVEGDRMTGVKTLPLQLGMENASRLTMIGMSLPLLISWVPFIGLNLSLAFLALYLVSGVIKMDMGLKLVKNPTPEVATSILKSYRYALMIQMIAWCFA
jgi:geranylgeranylglycerol-phosphate geranylgeranyltransferase